MRNPNENTKVIFPKSNWENKFDMKSNEKQIWYESEWERKRGREIGGSNGIELWGFESFEGGH